MKEIALIIRLRCSFSFPRCQTNDTTKKCESIFTSQNLRNPSELCMPTREIPFVFWKVRKSWFRSYQQFQRSSILVFVYHVVACFVAVAAVWERRNRANERCAPFDLCIFYTCWESALTQPMNDFCMRCGTIYAMWWAVRCASNWGDRVSITSAFVLFRRE